MPDRELLVRIVGDDRDLQRALGNTERKVAAIDGRMQTFGRNATRAFGAAGIAIGTAEILRLGADAVNAASDLNEQLSRTEVILGENAQATIEWSETTATAFGISQRAALAATATFAGLFQTVGVEQDAAGEMSRQIVQLAADLASLQNSSPEEALLALRSGLAGEAEPLRRFNIFLTEARVNMAALAATGKDNVKELTQQEKTLARFNLILQDSAPAQGNFADTSKELANQQRILRAQLDDLSTRIGGVLIPALSDAAEAANLLFIALDKFRGVDFSPGFDFPDPPDWLARGLKAGAVVAPISPLGGVAFGIKKALEDDAKEIKAALTGSRPSEQVAEVIDQIKEDAEAQTAKAAAAKAALERSRTRFKAFVKGMGLKLDRAGITATLDDDIAVLRELERAILRQIGREGRTFDLVQRLVDTRQQIASLVEQRAAEAKQAGVDAFEATIDALNLDLEVAQATQSLADDQAKLRAIEQAILNRIAAEGETTELLRRLFQVRQEQKDISERLAEQRRERIKSRQFQALGLTAEGDERVAGIGQIRRRARGLIEELQASDLPPDKIAAFVKRISAVFTDQFDNAGREVRQAILDLFKMIDDTLNTETRKGPLTKTKGLNTKRIIEGLGLTPEQERELRGRLSSINTAGRELAGQTPGAGSRTATTGGADVFVESHTTINLDGEQVARVVTRNQQKTRRRNPRQKRGPNRHGGV